MDIAETPSLSVAVATFRRPAGLRRLLAAIEPQLRSKPGREVVVVNDGSHNEEYAQVVQEFGDLVIYDEMPENLGIGAARNRAAALAKNDYLVYTDDDCEPPIWWLDWLSALLRQHPDLDVVAGTTRPLWTERRRFLERVQSHYDLMPRPRRVGNANIFVTANVAIRRRRFEELGGFAPLRAAEDTELSVRLTRSGVRSFIDHDWYVRHEVNGGIATQIRRYAGYGYANVLIARLNSAPISHSQFAMARRRFLGRHLKWALSKMRRRSKGFSANTAVRLLSVAAATAITASHYLGCARAAREGRRRSFLQKPRL